MKNIHILKTDKPSRLLKDLVDRIYQFEKEVLYGNRFELPLSIYITNDEEIKEGDWYINTFVSEREQKPQTHTEKRHLINHQKDYRFKYCKKIILTTDQDLINDGVQAIGDEFLEWFVKNPNCESVEVIKIEDELISPKNPKIRFNALQDPPSFISAESLNNMILTYKYKIIIPKEEPKQETLGYICPQTKKQCDDECCVSAKDCHLEASMGVLSEPKQETLEEIAERYYEDEVSINAFINGYKLAQEQTCNHTYILTSEQGHRVIKCSKCNDTKPI